MGDSTNTAELRKTAKDFLHGALWPKRSSVDDIAEEVIHLVLGDEPNPLTDLIKAKYAAREESSSPLPPLQNLKPSSGSKLSLKFPRMRNRSASSKDSPAKQSADKRQPDGQSVFQVDTASSTSLSECKYKDLLGLQPVRRAPSTPTQGGAAAAASSSDKASCSGPVTYNCVFCGNDYSVKGTCKRHLEDLHVAKRYYECMKCQHVSRSVPEAKKHMAQCSVGIIDWNTVKPPHRKAYSSEFVAMAPFKTQQAYIEHLLELCALPKEQRPRISWHLKLRNLLEQPELKGMLCALSKRMFEDPDGWREVRWEHDRVRRAVHRLEYGNLSRESDAHTKDPTEITRSFLEDLFANRVLAWSEKQEIGPQPSEASVSAESTAPSSSTGGTPRYIHGSLPQAASTQEMHQQAGPATDSVVGQYYNPPGSGVARIPKPMQASEQASKRPLSYETANQIPHRQPPGPPTTTYYVPNQNLPPTSSSAGETHWPQQGYHPPISSTVSPEMPPPYELSTGPNQQYGLSPSHAQQYPTAPAPAAVTTTQYAPQLPMTTANTGDFADFLLDDTAFLNIVSPAPPMNGSGAAYAAGTGGAGPVAAPPPPAGPGQIPVAPSAPPWPLQPAPPPPTLPPQQGQNIAPPQNQHHHHHHHHHPHSHPPPQHLHHQPHHGHIQTWFDASAGNM
ncbi:hypothetical protein D0864_16279 [Hortaea werneckii]|uniref:C2H2-type domain-containing protein n=1 Tax=Hortaea werneckii TaxID=91943 RepID=A0A3M7BKN4_HORWE|nr:hypothetical protein KC322_g4993 [Hortaea werneckii]RMY40341.1 hypothetical protein D0864_16279 [Hortaea werneckii]